MKNKGLQYELLGLIDTNWQEMQGDELVEVDPLKWLERTLAAHTLALLEEVKAEVEGTNSTKCKNTDFKGNDCDVCDGVKYERAHYLLLLTTRISAITGKQKEV